ncbi:MAG TPA: MBL fold metallo-hydrolase [Vitreimonas sp.]|uniref:MBL fold metallo-hydrolase n=1 Tax=Vitreimonas sp. TaxID=3069702 RepID=UPI002D6DE840|nr:MBL fold metallo-hydrolase [Vitreimonas sp.]HYD88000.1 MBL fold metallo-hydrolase [Vitreimonas sp.]
MAAKIPFVREMEFEYEKAQQVSPLIRRLVANNPGPFTFRGTGVYIVGRGEVAIIDPGPDNAEHIEALLRAVEGERVTHIFVTHRHMDHSPAAHPLAERTGAKVYASMLAPKPSECDELRLEAADDHLFQPHVDVRDRDRFSGPAWTIEAVFTPGHTANHMAYALLEENALFPGDHIMGWSTTVIGPPDGDMSDYLQSLEKVRDRDYTTLWPTHGPPVREVRPFVQAFIDHRLEREAQILTQLQAGKHAIKDMVSVIYADVDKRLHPAACHSVLAHIIRLVEQGRVTCDGPPCVDSEYWLRTAD